MRIVSLVSERPSHLPRLAKTGFCLSNFGDESVALRWNRLDQYPVASIVTKGTSEHQNRASQGMAVRASWASVPTTCHTRLPALTYRRL
jgi:hypothetical protein